MLKTGYSAEIDVTPNELGAAARVKELRKELNPQGIHVKVMTLSNENGNLELRLHTPNQRSSLRTWLDANGYSFEEIVNHANPNAVPRTLNQEGQ